MYLISFLRDGQVVEICAGNTDSLFAMACILQDGGSRFKVSNGLACLLPQDFGWGGFKCWVNRKSRL